VSCPTPENELRRCSRCKDLRPENEYLTKGYCGYCKACRLDKGRRYRSTHKEAIAARKKKYNQKNRERLDTTRRTYQEHNKEKIREYHRKYYADNRELKLEKVKRYRQENHQKILLRNQRYEQNRKSIDPVFATRRRLKTLIRATFRNAGLIKSCGALKIIGTSAQEFYDHLKNTFKNNYGREFIFGIDNVHIDHIIPMCSALTSEDVIKLNHYTNLQLLLADDNLKKGGKLPTATESEEMT
jgi:hypothetical protein